MRLALFSDLHANLPAFSACLEDAKFRGYDQILVLGDLVGYGPFPVEITQLCLELESKGAVILRGNHDQVAPVQADQLAGASAQVIAADWTFYQLDLNTRDWLWNLPFFHTVGDLACVHATMDEPEAWLYASDERQVARSVHAAQHTHQASIVCCGHVHEQYLFYQGSGREFMRFKPSTDAPIKISAHRQWLATIGSVGQPRDGDARANYAILDLASRQLQFIRVAYDVDATIAAVIERGLPRVLAERLETGK